MSHADKFIAAYLTLRARKAELEARHKEEIKAITEPMEKIEAALQKIMLEVGVKALPSTAGTAYLSSLTSVTVDDWDQYLEFVRENEAWEFLEKRANKTSVEQYAAAHANAAPPGVNLTERIRVNVRAPS